MNIIIGDNQPKLTFESIVIHVHQKCNTKSTATPTGEKAICLTALGK